MTLPVVERITLNIIETLETVLMVNGYDVDLTVQRRLQRGNVPVDGLVVVAQDSPTLSPNDAPQGRIAWRQTYTITCYVIESESSTTAVDQRVNLIRSDVERALRVDPNRGNLAVDTIIIEPALFDEAEGAFSGIDVRIDVLYRTLENNPYEQ